MKMTLYDILQVSEKAEKKVIESAYKGLVKKYHPDINKSPGAEQKMKEINSAYSVLRDPVKRLSYDLKLQSERNSFKNPPTSNPSPNYQNYNQGVKKEYVRPQQPKAEQKRETEPPPKKNTYQNNSSKNPPHKDPEFAKRLFRNICGNISKPYYHDLGIYSALSEDGNLEINDVGKHSVFDQLRFAIFLALTIGIGLTTLAYITEDIDRFRLSIKDEPITLLIYSVFYLIVAWSAFILRPKRYKLIFREKNFTIVLHKIFRRTIEYRKILYSKIQIDDPPFLKIILRRGKKIKTLRNANIMDLAQEIIEVMLKNKM